MFLVTEVRLQRACVVAGEKTGGDVVAPPHSRLAGAQLWSTEMLRAFVFEAVVLAVLAPFIACIVVWGAVAHSVAS